MQSLPPSCSVLPMDNDFIATLIPLSVVVAGMDYLCGNPLLHILGTLLTQNGF